MTRVTGIPGRDPISCRMVGYEDYTAYDHHRHGMELLELGQERDALEHLARAHLLEAANPQFQSAYGLGLARARREREHALKLARQALRTQFYDPQLFVNLAQIHLCFDERGGAVRALRRALAVDSDFERARHMIRQLGLRKRPVLPILGRDNPINRWLGLARARLRPATA